MEIKDEIHIVYEFIKEISDLSKRDIKNAIFIAQEISKTYIFSEFKGGGTCGIESHHLSALLSEIRSRKYDDFFSIAKKLSKFNSYQLKLMAAYLWNEGKSGLNQKERGEAYILLKEEMGLNNIK